MKKNIKPDWYNDDLYNEELSLSQWAKAIRLRESFYSNMVLFPKDKEGVEVLNKAFTEIIVDGYEKYIDYIQYGNFPKKLFENSLLEFFISGVLSHLNTCDDYISPPIEALKLDTSNGSFSIEEKDGDLFTGIPVLGKVGSGCVPVSINIKHYSDTRLKSEFENFLKEVRKTSKNQQREKECAEVYFSVFRGDDLMLHDDTSGSIFSNRGKLTKQGKGESEYKSSDFEKWHKFKLLGLIDILLWGEINGIKYTENKLSDYLYHNQEDGGVYNINTCKQWAYELLGGLGVERLEALKNLKKNKKNQIGFF